MIFVFDQHYWTLSKEHDGKEDEEEEGKNYLASCEQSEWANR